MPGDAPPAFRELKLRLEKIHDLDRAQAVLEWDQWVMMPPAGASARVEQLASLERARHERFGADEIGDLLEQSRDYERTLRPDSDDATLMRVVRRDYEKALRVPAGLQAQIKRAASLAEYAWRAARRHSDFSVMLPHLNTVIEMKRRYIECFDFSHPYDALLDDYEPGMSTAEIGQLLAELKSELVPLCAEVTSLPDKPDNSCLHGNFPTDTQWSLVLSILESMPLEGSAWRLDLTTHPFADGFSTRDIRLATRFDDHDLRVGLFSTIHEFGHGLYENGIDSALERTPLCRPGSHGLHESQAKFWENAVARSLPFCRRFFPLIQDAFPDQLADVSAEDFHRAVNHVEPSLIRTEADELTYDLHIILRFELEQEIFAGTLELKDLPEAWNERVRSYLGIDVPGDADGVLQDPHWADGSFGYFPTYSLGNVIAGQLWEAANEALPELEEQIERGKLSPLREWLRQNVHRYGRKLTSREVVESATGKPLGIGPYVEYLRAKFGSIYGRV
jgi:carboxypeptidase Taq